MPKLMYDDKNYTGNSPSTAALNDLSDVTISSASSGQILKYNGSGWVNDAVPSAGYWLTQSASAGATSVTFYDINIDSTSIFDLYSQNTSGTMIPYTSVTVGAGSATFTISALSEATTFKLWVRNL